jgi:hypothetical protein
MAGNAAAMAVVGMNRALSASIKVRRVMFILRIVVWEEELTASAVKQDRSEFLRINSSAVNLSTSKY